jgi:hypothetical protein
MATLAFWAQHRNGPGDDAREAQQDMERNDPQKYGRCRWHLNTGHVGHNPRPRNLSKIGSLASAPDIVLCSSLGIQTLEEYLSGMLGHKPPAICRLSSDFDEIVFQSFRDRLRRGGFLWSSEQRRALSCWEIGLEVQCGLLMAERVLFAPQFEQKRWHL